MGVSAAADSSHAQSWAAWMSTPSLLHLFHPHLSTFMKLASLALLLATAVQALAGSTDLSYPPTTSGGHDFNHSPVGQSFTAIASSVRAGIYLADETSFTAWLATVYPGQITPGSYPYAVAPSVTVKMDLVSGEGPGGTVLSTTTRTLTAPFSGFVEVDYGALGISLTVGQKYTLMLSDISGRTYPQGVSGWVVPSVTDSTSGAGQPVMDSSGNLVGYLPYGAYASGLPVLQGALVANDAGIGDNAFEVIDTAPIAPPPPPAEQTISGMNAVITAYVARNPGFIVINGGLNLNDHLWTTNLTPANTTFLGGLSNWYKTGLLVDYVGTTSPQGLILTSLTVKPAPSALVLSSANVPDGTVGVPYSAAVTVTGGLPPYTGTVTGLPAGLSFDGYNIVGTPTTSTVAVLNITILDSLGSAVSASPTLSIKPAPAHYTIKDESQGKITGIGAGFILVGTKKIAWNATTTIIVNKPTGSVSVIDTFVKVGMRAQWKGLRDAATNTVMASKLEIN